MIILFWLWWWLRRGVGCIKIFVSFCCIFLILIFLKLFCCYFFCCLVGWFCLFWLLCRFYWLIWELIWFWFLGWGRRLLRLVLWIGCFVLNKSIWLLRIFCLRFLFGMGCWVCFCVWLVFFLLMLLMVMFFWFWLLVVLIIVRLLWWF